MGGAVEAREYAGFSEARVRNTVSLLTWAGTEPSPQKSSHLSSPVLMLPLWPDNEHFQKYKSNSRYCVYDNNSSDSVDALELCRQSALLT